MPLITNHIQKNQEAALDVLASLTYQNSHIASKVSANSAALDRIVKLLRDRRPIVRLLAAKCMTNLAQTRSLPADMRPVICNLVPHLVKLLKETLPRILEEGPTTLGILGVHSSDLLAHLIESDEELQTAANEAGVIPLLVKILKNPDATPKQHQVY